MTGTIISHAPQIRSFLEVLRWMSLFKESHKRNCSSLYIFNILSRMYNTLKMILWWSDIRPEPLGQHAKHYLWMGDTIRKGKKVKFKRLQLYGFFWKASSVSTLAESKNLKIFLKLSLRAKEAHIYFLHWLTCHTTNNPKQTKNKTEPVQPWHTVC